MSQAVSETDVVQAALALDAPARGRLAEQLWASLDADGRSGPPLSAEWDAEVARRVAAVRAGTATTVDADEVFRQVRRRLTR